MLNLTSSVDHDEGTPCKGTQSNMKDYSNWNSELHVLL